MHIDVEEFLNFYATPLGKAVAKVVSRRLFYMADLNPRMKILGVGYPTPFLSPLQKYVERSIALMSAQQGVIAWPSNGKNLTLLSDEGSFPLLDGFFDRIFVMHGLEFCEDPSEFLKEIWRVLSPQGRVIFAIPNRKGYWASFGHTPFGHGKPYTTKQLRTLLERHSFSFIKRERALYFPPVSWGPIVRTAATWEKAGGKFYRAVSGLLLIEVEKTSNELQAMKVRSRVFVEKPALGIGI